MIKFNLVCTKYKKKLNIQKQVNFHILTYALTIKDYTLKKKLYKTIYNLQGEGVGIKNNS